MHPALLGPVGHLMPVIEHFPLENVVVHIQMITLPIAKCNDMDI
jgi:hypothetical protein